MLQQRLNHIMIFSIHHKIADTLDLNAVGNEFASMNDKRMREFGTFVQQE